MHIALEGGMVAVPLPTELSRRIVYHYTNAVGLLGIVEHDELWASSAVALNDLSEMTYGLDVLREATEARKDAPSETVGALIKEGAFAPLRDSPYFLCASTLNDSLNQWIGYAGRQGYSVGIRTKERLVKRRKDGQERSTGRPLSITEGALMGTNGWYQVIYKRGDQLRVVNDLLDFCKENNLLTVAAPHARAHAITMFGAVLAQLKHQAFADEREVRFITGRNDDTDERYRAGAYGVVPYTRLIAAGREEYDSALPAGLKLPIASVTTGPANADERSLIESSARRLLDARGYGSAKVKTSAAPYRY